MKILMLPETVSCILRKAMIYLDPTILTICTMPFNVMNDENELIINERVRRINGIIGEIQRSSILPLRLLDFAPMIEDSLPGGCSSDGICFVRPKGVGWLNKVFQRHINNLESDLLETWQFTFGHPQDLPFSQSDRWKTGWEKELILDTAQGAAGAGSRARRQWRRT